MFHDGHGGRFCETTLDLIVAIWSPMPFSPITTSFLRALNTLRNAESLPGSWFPTQLNDVRRPPPYLFLIGLSLRVMPTQAKPPPLRILPTSSSFSSSTSWAFLVGLPVFHSKCPIEFHGGNDLCVPFKTDYAAYLNYVNRVTWKVRSGLS